MAGAAEEDTDMQQPVFNATAPVSDDKANTQAAMAHQDTPLASTADAITLAPPAAVAPASSSGMARAAAAVAPAVSSASGDALPSASAGSGLVAPASSYAGGSSSTSHGQRQLAGATVVAGTGNKVRLRFLPKSSAQQQQQQPPDGEPAAKRPRQ